MPEPMPFTPKSKLPRLSREWYQSRAVVFWTHTIEGRVTGWLDDRFHQRFREVLLHACSRYALACPVYVLMPDHWHVVWMGLAPKSDQRLAAAFFREHITPQLGEAKLQDRPHDRVLREEQRKRGAFMNACDYVRENPVRGGLTSNWRDWPYVGAAVSGYPDLNPQRADFWEIFWKIYNRSAEQS